MAFSSTKVSRSIAGNVIMEVHTWNAASVTSGNISVGVGQVLHCSVNNLVSEGEGLAVPSGQTIALSSVTSNDTGTILVIGIA